MKPRDSERRDLAEQLAASIRRDRTALGAEMERRARPHDTRSKDDGADAPAP